MYEKIMNAYDEDLEKYWYVRTTTLNKNTFGSFVRWMQKIINAKRKAKAREEKTRINATKKRNSSYVKKIFNQHYWNIDYCMICWSKDNLHIHHKDKNRRNNEYTNLIKICVNCHLKAHEWEKAWEFLWRIYNKIKNKWTMKKH